MKIALDAMGGDFGPPNLVPGAVMALREYAYIDRLYLVGDPRQIEGELRKHQCNDARIEIVQPALFVSRSGDKLAAALDAFHIEPRGTIGLDVGCSTGGFTDCLLQRGATRIYAIDVGYGQFEWRLRKDSRVVLLERTNIRYVDRAAVPEPIDLAVIDVSFISLTLVLPAVVHLLNSSAVVVVLVKPQFEVGKGQVGRGGIVRDDAQREAVTEKVIACAAHLGLQLKGVLDSPVIGRKGNREILVGFTREITT